MLPRTLWMQAFGPYVEAQQIDFSSFPSLFLIRGETGSGKTMILDAMTYALYGKSSGGQREDLESMRSRFAKDEQPTKISFTFSLRDHVYCFQRCVEVKTRRNQQKTYKVSVDAGEVIDGVFLPFFENPKLKNVEEKAIELIGLRHEQFIQVMVLPQGRFEQLLTSKSEEKQEILRTLFQMERWETLSERLSEQANLMRKEMETRKQKIEALWQSVEANHMEQILLWISQLQQEQAALQQTLTGLTQQHKDQLHELQQQLQLHQAASALQQVEQLEQECKAQEASIKAEQALVAQYQRYEKILPYFEQKQHRQDELLQREQTLNIAIQQQQLIEQEAIQLPAWQQQREVMQQQIQQLQQQQGEWRSCQDLFLKLDHLKKQLDTLQQEGIEAKQAWQQQEQATMILLQQYEELMQQYLQDSAMQLREQLKEGTPCPVCGSLQHPTHEVMQQQYLDVVTLQDKQQELDQARATKEQLQLAHVKLMARIKEQEETFGREQNAYQLHCQQLGMDPPLQQKQEWDHYLKQQESLLLSYTAQHKQTEDNCNRVLTSLAEARQRSLLAQEEAQLAQTRYQEAQQAYEQHQGLRFDEVQLKKLPDAKQIECIIEHINVYETKQIQLQTQKQELIRQLDGQQQKELPELKETVASLEESIRKQQQAFAQCVSKQQLYEGVIKQGSQLQEDYEKRQPSYQKLLDFSRAIRGDNSIGIERYVLGIMLSHITQTANQLLSKVHHGRYQLYRSEHASNKTRKFGLEFSIYDSYTCAMRSVVSLSGGEKFLVSLALSLALSSSVQARNGGIQFDCMFIDEGFGTLDEHSIADALTILESMGKQKGKIGIISHVELLKENIPGGIEVLKSRTGSAVHIRKE